MKYIYYIPVTTIFPIIVVCFTNYYKLSPLIFCSLLSSYTIFCILFYGTITYLNLKKELSES